MKKFKFSLQSLLNLKISLEKQQKYELAEAEARERELKRQLEDMRGEFSAAREDYNRRAAEGINVLELVNYSNFFAGLRERIERQLEAVAVAEAEKERVQRALIETMRERKALEKLREKKFAEYLEECAREDEKAVSDFLASRVAMGMRDAQDEQE